jgi:hypothetical protein
VLNCVKKNELKMDIENENDFSLTPPEIREAAEVASFNLLPEKSRKVWPMNLF